MTDSPRYERQSAFATKRATPNANISEQTKVQQSTETPNAIAQAALAGEDTTAVDTFDHGSSVETTAAVITDGIYHLLRRLYGEAP